MPSSHMQRIRQSHEKFRAEVPDQRDEDGEATKIDAEEDNQPLLSDEPTKQPDDADPDNQVSEAEDHLDEDEIEAANQERLHRLAKKMSVVEKERAEALKRAEAAEQRLIELQNQKQQSEPSKSTPPDADLEEQVRKDLIAEIGEDDWEYMDAATQRALIATTKRAYQRSSSDNVEAKIKATLAQRDEVEQRKTFKKNLDEKLKPFGLDAVKLANSPDFLDWVDASRSRSAVFNASMETLDKEAVNDITKLVQDFYRENASRKSNDATPKVNNSGSKANTKQRKTTKITFEQYQQAVKDKMRPMKRDAARKIIAAYHAQQK